jgi:4-hydroxy-tetrahydrodipicolinate reductase
MTVRAALIGMGKMGRAIAMLAPERDVELVATIARGPVTGGRLGDADVALEFTEPGAAPGNIRACLAAGCPVVVGTTGWYEHLPSLAAEVAEAGGALLWAANFSVGVNLYLSVVNAASRIMAPAGFDAHIVETHHAAKKDAPSGTAQAMARAAADGGLGAVPITSVRAGHVPGTHELLLDAPFEQIRLVHAARDRRVFADGALLAARWLVGRRGVYTMSDVLAGPAEPS